MITKMYNLLVVDDEELMRNGISGVVSSMENNSFNIFCAENGLQALDIIQKHNIHAMILDIKMPKLDGVGVLRVLNEKKINIKTIVLSGYEEFEYAKVAIEAGALNYVVKPVVPKEIHQVIGELIVELDKEDRLNNEIENLRKQMQENLDLIKEKFFNDILNKRISKEVFQSRSEFLNLKIRGNIFQVAVLDIIKYNYFATEEKYQLINYSIYQFLKQYISTMEYMEYFQLSSSQFIIVCCFEQGSSLQLNEELNNLKTRIDGKFNICSTIGVGNAYEGFENIKRTYLEAVNTVRYQILSGRENIASISEIHEANISYDYLFDAEEFTIRMKLGDIEGVKNQLNTMFEQIETQKENSFDIESFNLFCMKLLICTFTALKSLNLDFRSIDINERQELSEIYEMKSYLDIKNKIIRIIERVSNKVEEYKKDKKRITVEKVKSIINQYYAQDITVKFIADQLYLNQNYLGQLFKNETDISIIDYLNKVRVTKSKALLKNTDLMVYQIAEQVGFNDSQYFSTVFKKIVGVTPKEYKEI
jgi:two-component system response regulator YesN